MNLTSLAFFCFLIITLLIYFIMPKKYSWCVLLVSSLIFLFYDNLSINTIIQVIIVLVPSYICGILIEKNQNTNKAKIFLLLGIIAILGQLIYLKYTNLFIATANHICNLLKINRQFDFIYRNSLIGISYYSLIMISYLTDIYRGICKSQKNIFKCALFMTYFPILTSGPFIRYKDIEKDLYKKHKINYENLCNGLLRMLWGIFKVIVISQRLAIFVNRVYGNLDIYCRNLYYIGSTIFYNTTVYKFFRFN